MNVLKVNHLGKKVVFLFIDKKKINIFALHFKVSGSELLRMW